MTATDAMRAAFLAWADKAYPNIVASKMPRDWIDERVAIWQAALESSARQPVQEPVAEVVESDLMADGVMRWLKPLKYFPVGTKLYAAPVAASEPVREEGELLRDARDYILMHGTGPRKSMLDRIDAELRRAQGGE